MSQRETNPYKYSDTNKRYRTYEYYLRGKFGGRCVKIPIDAGFTCPNIDGRCGYGGCIYCSGRGSGDFAGTPEKSISEQFKEGIELLSGKWDTSRKIAYFQAHTNKDNNSRNPLQPSPSFKSHLSVATLYHLFLKILDIM